MNAPARVLGTGMADMTPYHKTAEATGNGYLRREFALKTIPEAVRPGMRLGTPSLCNDRATLNEEIFICQAFIIAYEKKLSQTSPARRMACEALMDAIRHEEANRRALLGHMDAMELKG